MSYDNQHSHVAAECAMAQHHSDIANADQIDGQCDVGRTPHETHEQILRRIWGMVLRVDDVSSIQTNDSSFALGGDFYSINQLVTEARRCGIVLSASDVYQSPRLSELAELSLTNSEHRVDDDDANIEPFDLIRHLLNDDLEECQKQLADLCNVDMEAIEDAYPCTPLQEGLFALSQKVGGVSEKYTPLHLKTTPRHPVEQLHDCLERSAPGGTRPLNEDRSA